MLDSGVKWSFTRILESSCLKWERHWSQWRTVNQLYCKNLSKDMMHLSQDVAMRLKPHWTHLKDDVEVEFIVFSYCLIIEHEDRKSRMTPSFCLR